MSDARTISATAFKATCLAMLDEVAAGKIETVTITRRGKPVAVLSRPPAAKHPFDVLYGMMKGSVIAPPDFDFTEPAFTGVMEAAQGLIGGKPRTRRAMPFAVSS